MGSIQWEIASFSDIGGRKENQDRAISFVDADTGEAFIVVADGMGGHRGGVLASESIIKTAEQCWKDRTPPVNIESFLNNFVEQAHQAVRQSGEAQKLSPRSTLAALWLNNDKAVSIHVGDSRIIQLNDQGFVQRSIDHSIVQLLVLQGKITEEEMATHPDQSKMTTSMGGDEKPEPEITEWSLDKGDRFIVCTDGFWEITSYEQMQAILAATNLEDDLASSSRKNIGRAPDDQDNTTSIAIRPKTSEKSQKTPPPPSPPSAPPAQPATNTKKPQRSLILPIVVMVIIAATLAWFVYNDDSGTPTSTPTGKPGSPAGKPDSSGNSEPDDKKSPPDDGDAPVDSDKDKQSGKSPLGKHDNVNEKPAIPVSGDKEVEKKVTEYFRKNNRIGKNDTLVQGKTRKVKDSKLSQLQQKYKGIKVYGAVVTVVRKQGSVDTVQGKLASEINISIIPKLTYQQAIDKINLTTQPKLETIDKGQLVILNYHDEYILTWQGHVQGADDEIIFIDTTTAKILLRFPLAIDE